MKALLIATLGAGLLAGCAFVDPARLPPGTSAADVRARLGEPTGRFAGSDGGQRLEYATGPFGKHTWMLDFDAGGTLRSAEQVLTEKRFHQIGKGMNAEEVRRQIGRPGEVWQVGWNVKQDVWAYRYETPFCQWFMVGFDPRTRQVVDTAYGLDPMCSNDLDF